MLEIVNALLTNSKSQESNCKHFINECSPALLKISRTSLFVRFDENKKFFKNPLTNPSKYGIIVSERERNTKKFKSSPKGE